MVNMEELITAEEVEHYSLKAYAVRSFAKQDTKKKVVPIAQLLRFSRVCQPLFLQTLVLRQTFKIASATRNH